MSHTAHGIEEGNQKAAYTIIPKSKIIADLKDYVEVYALLVMETNDTTTNAQQTEEKMDHLL